MQCHCQNGYHDNLVHIINQNHVSKLRSTVCSIKQRSIAQQFRDVSLWHSQQPISCNESHVAGSQSPPTKLTNRAVCKQQISPIDWQTGQTFQLLIFLFFYDLLLTFLCKPECARSSYMHYKNDKSINQECIVDCGRGYGRG